MTQQDEILHYLQTHKTPLTNKMAYEKFGATRLGGVIYNLRKLGYRIKTIPKVVKTRYGTKVQIAGYVYGLDSTDTELG